MAAPPKQLKLDPTKFPKEVKGMVEELNLQGTDIYKNLNAGLTLGENVVCEVRTLRVRGAAMWITPTLLGTWTVGSSRPPQYRKDEGGRVWLRGRATGGLLNQDVYVLPVGYRPDQDLDLCDNANSAYGNFQVFTTGSVQPQTGATTHDLIASFLASDTSPGPTLEKDVVFSTAYTTRPLALLIVSCYVADKQDVPVPTWNPAWRYEAGKGTGVANIRISSIPGIRPATDHTVTFLVIRS
jgi:hypothetical protein